MKLLDVNGKEISVRISPSSYSLGRTYRSKLQRLVAEKLVELYPYEAILEDWTIPGSRMSVDFFIPRLKLVFEIDGKQHKTYNAYHHGQVGSGKFLKQKMRDSSKENWSDINGFKFIRITNEREVEEFITAAS